MTRDADASLEDCGWDLRIRAFEIHDLSGILGIQSEAGLSGWGEEDYRRLAAAPGGLILTAAEGDGGLAGFAAARLMADQAELLNMATALARRRKGVGRALVREVCRQMQAAGAQSMALEVRRSNAPAISLYRSSGFTPRGVRKNYYSIPLEDACVMMLSFKPCLSAAQRE